jgi:integrase/recombinase XerD
MEGEMLKKQKFKDHIPTLPSVIQNFLRSRKAKGFAPGTLRFYHQNMQLFQRFVEQRSINFVEEINSLVLDDYMTWMTETGHKDGGKYMAYRTLKTFIRWYIVSYEPEGYRDPFLGYRGPKKSKLILDPVPVESVEAMLKACPVGTFVGDRDKAILMVLIDTGLRANELVQINMEDLSIDSGKIMIEHGKGDKKRVVFFGEKTRKALRRYLRWRGDAVPEHPLFSLTNGERVSYWSLRDMVEDRAKQAGVPHASLHSFRRGFALYSLQNGMDVYSLQHLMGHADLQVLRHYLKQSEQDLKIAHMRNSPMDRMKDDR